jgi:hypothetical protein
MTVTNSQSGTNVHEIAAGIFRISTPVAAIPGGFTFNQILVADVVRIDEHLIGCETCTAESEHVSAIVKALRAFVPPIVSRAKLESLRARGLRLEENTFAPGQRQSVVFGAGIDLLILCLAGLDLSSAQRVQVTVRVESTGELLFEDPNAPFDRYEGVLIACQRHFAALPPDTVFEVRALDESGTEHTAVYTIPHVFEV